MDHVCSTFVLMHHLSGNNRRRVGTVILRDPWYNVGHLVGSVLDRPNPIHTTPPLPRLIPAPRANCTRSVTRSMVVLWINSRLSLARTSLYHNTLAALRHTSSRLLTLACPREGRTSTL